MLVVRGGKKQTCHHLFTELPDLVTADQVAVKGYREGLRVETSKGPLGQVALEGEGHGGSFDFLCLLFLFFCCAGNGEEEIGAIDHFCRGRDMVV